MSPGTSGASSPRSQTGPMDDFLTTTDSQRGLRHIDKMAPTSPDANSAADSAQGLMKDAALAQISTELAAISANMFTRSDRRDMITELRAVVREEIQGVHRDLATLEHRVEEMEAESQHTTLHQQKAVLATTRQGSMIMELRHQVEDLDNRSTWNNVRIQVLPKSEAESLQEVLTGLFTQLLWGGSSSWL
ncbi:Hypothetical predicted protein [Pelobates cultripes]|uniref:Uncharacterized protein n=1 Tax=Pelobates cultripes TaxID=61616 RepID=A0AAD1WKD5_PELCU|nr:Hypothetical predicted protein [Pelobates cultripes]